MVQLVLRMATGFFVEFRLHGYAKKYAKWVKTHVHDKNVPHVTLFGPAKTYDLGRVISEVMRISYKYTLIPFTINGFSRFDNKTDKVLYLDINPSPELEQFRWELAQGLLKISRTKSPWDNNRTYKFHSTIKKFRNISDSKFDKLCDYVERRCKLQEHGQYSQWQETSFLDKLLHFIKKHFEEAEPEDNNIGQHLLRITILGGRRKILCEYDLILKKLMNRREALRKYWWRKTISKFREIQAQY